MQITTSLNDPIVSEVLLSSKLVVAQTDTVYGILALAEDPVATKYLYQIRHRNINKSSIVLVADISQIPDLSETQKSKYQLLNNERPTTLITQVASNFLCHLPKQDSTLAFRVINYLPLKQLLKLTGPVIAPSANLEGKPTATNVTQAQNYFGNNVAVYVNTGESPNNSPSRIVKITNGQLEIIRE